MFALFERALEYRAAWFFVGYGAARFMDAIIGRLPLWPY